MNPKLGRIKNERPGNATLKEHIFNEGTYGKNI
jgi:hypothetical protein